MRVQPDEASSRRLSTEGWNVMVPMMLDGRPIGRVAVDDSLR
jgi:hypothetical protein